MIESLSYLHVEGYVHANLSLQSFYIDKEENPKLGNLENIVAIN